MSLRQDLPPDLVGAHILQTSTQAIDRLLAGPRNGIHASGITDPAPRPFSIAAKRRLLMGHYVEDKWLDIWREAGILLWPKALVAYDDNGGAETGSSVIQGVVGYDKLPWEYHAPEGYVIQFTPDAVVQVLGEPRLVEIKSVGPDVWKQIQTYGSLQKWINRTRVYLMLARESRTLVPGWWTTRPLIATTGYILIEDRATCAPKIVSVTYTPAHEATLRGLIKQIVEGEAVDADDGELDEPRTEDRAMAQKQEGLIRGGNLGRFSAREHPAGSEGRGADSRCPEPVVGETGAGSVPGRIGADSVAGPGAGAPETGDPSCGSSAGG